MGKRPIPVYSQSEAARRLGLSRARVAGLIEGAGISTYRMALNGKAKGLTEDGFRRLERIVRSDGFRRRRHAAKASKTTSVTV